MTQTRNLQTLRATMSPQALAEADRQTRDLRAEMLLSEIRKQQELTQAMVARTLGITQPSLSKMEVADDMQLSTLRRLVAALGLELDVAVVFADGRRVDLTQFRDPRSLQQRTDPPRTVKRRATAQVSASRG